jgi:pyruvate dehydrogenase (quinone)
MDQAISSTKKRTTKTPRSIEEINPDLNTADILVEKLIAWKVEQIFSLVGDGVNPIYESLRKRKDRIRLITVRHEEAAAFMAAGYAKATGKLGVCLATSGPGAVHLMNGLYDAAMENAPVLAITGSVYHDLLGTKFIQEVDTVAMLRPIAIYNQLITGPVHAITVVDLACRSALMHPGVAHVTIPTDIQQKQLKEDKHSMKAGELTGSSTISQRKDLPPEEEIQRAADLLNGSSKIMILAGRGALGATDELEALAEKLAAPVAKALLGKALLPDDSPYTTGGIGRLGTLPSKKMMDECDMLLILGSTMPYLEYYPKPDQAIGIQVDRDAGRLGLRFPIEVGLHGDVGATLRELLPKIAYHENREFLENAQQQVKEWRDKMKKLETDKRSPIQPPYLVAELSKFINDDALITIDTGAHTVFTARHFPVKKDQQLIVCGNLASMGPALPYAIAGQIAFPQRQCVAICGDGGFTMLMGELATAVYYQLPIKIVVFKNNQLAMDRFEQEEIGGRKYGIDLYPIDFRKIAEACGAKAFHCNDPLKLPDILSEAFQSSQCVLIEIDVDPDASPDPPEKFM